MREILFRGKSQYTGRWGESVCPLGMMHSGHLCDDFIPETVGQFTGLIVKGKRWFEHDIVSVRDEGEEIYRFIIAFGVCGGVHNVKHTVGYMGFHFIPANEETRRCMDAGARNDPLYWLNAYDCEVIGNIHDNPELLEVSK